MSRKKSSGTVWSLLASSARRIWRSSSTFCERRVAEELFLAENFGVGKLRAGLGDGGVAFFDLEEAEQLRGVDDRQQVVDLEGEVVGQAIDVVAAALVEQQFEQSGDAAGARMGQHLVVHLALVADTRAGMLMLGRLGGSDVGPREHLVDVVDQLREGLGFAVARLRNLHPEIGADVARDCGPAR